MSKERPTKITQSSLENAALHYLERYDSSSANLRQVLIRRLRRASMREIEVPEDAVVWVDAVVAKLVRLGYVDDQRYTSAKVSSLRARGASTRKVLASLASKGVGQELIQHALQAVDEQCEDGELNAAMIFARKRRLGPYRLQNRSEFRDKDLAALGRAGFGWGVAKTVIDLEE
jgi:regulatory protein